LIVATPPPLPTQRRYECPWCAQAIDPSKPNCPACGAPIDVRAAVTDSGWTELPAIRDMAKLQFGQSFCQIEGKYVPVADFNLAAGDGVYFAHHLLLWKDTQSQITRMPLAKGWTRFIAGLPLIMTQATGPGRIAFSKDQPGELIALPLQANQAVDVREHVFMIATHSIAYDWFKSGIWFETPGDKSNEIHYPIGMFLDRFATTQNPGLLLLHGAGNVFVRTLARGEAILIKPTSLLFKDTTVSMNLHYEHPGGTWQSWRSWGNRYIWLRMTGPGRVAVQSNYEPGEDSGNRIVRTEPNSTRFQW
jgi:uncharacterized protein (AIM24 family)